jgi:hypothetical protein
MVADISPLRPVAACEITMTGYWEIDPVRYPCGATRALPT